jgi:hypothetical protein
MRLISTRKRCWPRYFPPMVRIVGGALPVGLVITARGFEGVPTMVGSTTVTMRAVSGPTDFRKKAGEP